MLSNPRPPLGPSLSLAPPSRGKPTDRPAFPINRVACSLSSRGEAGARRATDRQASGHASSWSRPPSRIRTSTSASLYQCPSSPSQGRRGPNAGRTISSGWDILFPALFLSLALRYRHAIHSLAFSLTNETCSRESSWRPPFSRGYRSPSPLLSDPPPRPPPPSFDSLSCPPPSPKVRGKKPAD